MEELTARNNGCNNGCALCGRQVPLTFHHLIPKKNHSNKWFKKRFTRQEMLSLGIHVCRPCHNTIHRVFNEKELGRHYNTREALLAHKEIAKFVAFIQKKG